MPEPIDLPDPQYPNKGRDEKDAPIAGVFRRFTDGAIYCQLSADITPEEGAAIIQVITLKMGEMDFDPERFGNAIMQLSTGMGVPAPDAIEGETVEEEAERETGGGA